MKQFEPKKDWVLDMIEQGLCDSCKNVVDEGEFRADFDCLDVLYAEGCMRVQIGDKIFHIVVSEIDSEGNTIDGP